MDLSELGAELARTLTGRGITIALAESCTGGLVADTITNVAGSSEYFLGSIVSYANEVKENLVGVPRETLAEHGAVSEQVALAMARGTRARLGATVGLGITGIAGPGGATPTKPVGLVHMAVVGPWGEVARRHVMEGDRLTNKRLFAAEAMKMLIDYVSGRDEAPEPAR